MHREKRQNRITEQRKIQKEICRIPDLYHDTEYDMCRESDGMQRPKITGTDGTYFVGRARTGCGKSRWKYCKRG